LFILGIVFTFIFAIKGEMKVDMIEKYLKAKVCDILPSLNGKIFPGAAPQKTATPYAVYTCTASSEDTTLTGDPPLFTESIQFDIYADTYKEAKGYFDTLRISLLDFRGDLSGYPVKRIKVVNALDGYEPEVLEQKVTFEFEIYY
jgi:hypothetical protein